MDRGRRAGRSRALSGAGARRSLGIVVAGAVIEVVAGMCGDRPAVVVVTAPVVRFRSCVVSALMLRRGRMMGMRIGRLVFARDVVGRVMEAGQAPGVRRERRDERKQHQGACESESRRMSARADHRQRMLRVFRPVRRSTIAKAGMPGPTVRAPPRDRCGLPVYSLCPTRTAIGPSCQAIPAVNPAAAIAANSCSTGW